ncbi:MAG: RNA 2',3'-cyclic phosphodiesterase [Hyphomicrobiaceae bacterium]|nr:MAG: RNA 2',3'-cyclic phosphodiesterase [Hyphomicrobiaceae bacterium]
MPRLFTGIEIPPDIKARLSLLIAPMHGAKWVDAEDFHLTLRFLGDVEDRIVDEFLDLVADTAVMPFRLTLNGLGCFGGRQPRAIWAGIDPCPEIERLNQAHERAARAVGLEPDARVFKPHVTLARLKGTRPEAVAEFLGHHGAFKAGPIDVTAVAVFSSRPKLGGGPYAVIEKLPLSGVHHPYEDEARHWD